MKVNVSTVMDSYAHFLFVSGASANTIRHRIGTIRRVADAGIDPLRADPLDLVSWLAGFESAATRHSYRSALRSFFQWAVDFSVLADDPSSKLPKVKVPPTFPRPVQDSTLASLVAATTNGTRAVVLLMAYCGLRGSEACNVRPDDFSCVEECWWLRVTKPKGGGVQAVPVPRWIEVQVRDCFPLVASYQATIKRISRLLDSIEPGATPHALRHWYATNALRSSHNVRAVQEMMRHKSLASTQIYTAVSSSELSAAAESLPRIAVPAG